MIPEKGIDRKRAHMPPKLADCLTFHWDPKPRNLQDRTEMASKTTVLEHPSVGRIQGIQSDKHPHVEQYLGIQYAKLANRFARGTLLETYSGPIQATQTGYIVPSPPDIIATLPGCSSG